VMFAVEYELAPLNPHLNHLVNVILYALTAFLLFITLSALLRGNLVVPLIATLLFTAHPVHTEVVANIKSRDEILSFLFTIGSFYFLAGYIHNRSNRRLVISGLLFFLALLSKESAITCVAAAPLIYWYFSKDREVKNTLKPL